MPRKLRLEYPGAMYHVLSRGDRREKIFLDDVDRHDFIKTLAEACQKTQAGDCRAAPARDNDVNQGDRRASSVGNLQSRECEVA